MTYSNDVVSVLRLAKRHDNWSVKARENNG